MRVGASRSGDADLPDPRGKTAGGTTEPSGYTRVVRPLARPVCPGARTKPPPGSGEVDPVLKSTLSQSSIGAALLDPAGHVLWANPALRNLLGLAGTALAPRDLGDIVLPRNAQKLRGLLRRLRAGNARAGQVEFRCARPDGSLRRIRGSLSVTCERKGSSRRLLALLEGITDSAASAQRDAVLARLALHLSTATQPREAAWMILQAASDLLGWDAAYLHLLSADGRIMPILTVDTVRGERVEVPETAFTLDPSPVMLRVMQSGALLLNRGRRGTGSRPRLPLVPFGDTTRRSACMLYVPIRYRRQAVGIMSIQSYTPKAYTSQSLETLKTLGAQGAGALQRIYTRGALAESERNFRTLLEALPDALIRCRADGTILDFKAAAFCKCAHSRAAWQGQPLSVFLAHCCHPDPDPVEELLAGHSEPRTLTIRCLRSGTEIEVRLVPGRSGEFLLVLRDMSETMRLQREILEISDQERRAVGHDLHDVLGAHLAGTAFQARILLDSLSAMAPSLLPASARLLKLINSAVRQTRQIARGLDPVFLEGGNLPLALKNLSREITTLFNIRCAFATNLSQCALAPSTVLHLYRIAQEATQNAVRHGHAATVRIEWHLRRSQFRLSIRDDGRGFPARTGSAAGMGLRLMRYRANLIGARLSIASRRGHGTTVCCTLPRTPLAHRRRDSKTAALMTARAKSWKVSSSRNPATSPSGPAGPGVSRTIPAPAAAKALQP